MAFGCKLCILSKGLKGSEVRFLPQTEEELCEHIEEVHGVVVKRYGETEDQAYARYFLKFPERAAHTN